MIAGPAKPLRFARASSALLLAAGVVLPGLLLAHPALGQTPKTAKLHPAEQGKTCSTAGCHAKRKVGKVVHVASQFRESVMARRATVPSVVSQIRKGKRSAISVQLSALSSPALTADR